MFPKITSEFAIDADAKLVAFILKLKWHSLYSQPQLGRGVQDS